MNTFTWFKIPDETDTSTGANYTWIGFGRDDLTEVSFNPENSTHVYFAYNKPIPIPKNRKVYKHEFQAKFPIEHYVRAPQFSIRFTDSLTPISFSETVKHASKFTRNSRNAFLHNNINAPMVEINKPNELKMEPNVKEGLILHPEFENYCYTAAGNRLVPSIRTKNNTKERKFNTNSTDNLVPIDYDGVNVKLDLNNRKAQFSIGIDELGTNAIRGKKIWVTYLFHSSSKNCIYETAVSGLGIGSTEVFVIGQPNYNNRNVKPVTKTLVLPSELTDTKLPKNLSKPTILEAKIQSLDGEHFKVTACMRVNLDPSETTSSIDFYLTARQFDSKIINESNRSVDLHFYGFQVTTTDTPAPVTRTRKDNAKAVYECNFEKVIPKANTNWYMSLDVVAPPPPSDNKQYTILKIDEDKTVQYESTQFPGVTTGFTPLSIIRKGKNIIVSFPAIRVITAGWYEEDCLELTAVVDAWSPIIITIENDYLEQKLKLYIGNKKEDEVDISDKQICQDFIKLNFGNRRTSETGTVRLKEFSVYDGLFVDK